MSGKNILNVFLLAVPLFLLTVTAHASDIFLNGFFQTNYSVNVAGSNPDGGDFKWAEERLQIKLEASKDPFRIFVKTDAFYDHLERKADLELREGYLDFTSGKWDTRIGRLILTWGLGDLIFINDVFPKDYEAFFSGRPLEYLKKGIDGIKIGMYPDFASFEFIAIPFFEPNNFPDSARFHVFDPLRGVTDRREEKPAETLENAEVAFRVYRDVADFDASLYAYRGFVRQPSVVPDDPTRPSRLILFFPKLSVYGASLQGRAFDGVLSLEAGYYDSRDDRRGTNPSILNSHTRFLVGYQRQIWEDFTVGLQYYGEYMHDYREYEKNLPQGFPKERKLHDLFTVRLTQLFVHQTLKLSFFSFWSLSDGDYLINPEVKYNFSDHFWAAIGSMIFGGGEEWSQFGQLAKNDNVYLQARYEF